MCVCAVVSTRLVAIFTGLCRLSWKLPCSRIALVVAEVCSLAFSVLGAVAYVPQLVVTYFARGQGSLSYVSYAIQALIAVPYVAYALRRMSIGDNNDPPMDIAAELWVFFQPPLLASAFLTPSCRAAWSYLVCLLAASGGTRRGWERVPCWCIWTKLSSAETCKSPRRRPRRSTLMAGPLVEWTV